MPLTAFQSGVVRLLAAHRSPDSYLAGGAALHIAPQSLRYSNDLDYFQDSAERVASAFDEDRALLIRKDYEVRVLLERPGFVRAVVGRGAESTKVEWVHDTAWRFLPTIHSPQAGYVLHPIDLAVNKLLALVGREEPRDYLDTLYTHEHVLALGALVWAAAGKDPGFTPLLLLDLLRRRGKYRPGDFARLHLREPPDLIRLKAQWLAALDHAAQFIAKRSPDEVGCLYYDVKNRQFVSDFEAGNSDVVPHFGRPGGVLPQVIEE